jgi:hypothetical protein
LIPPPLDGMVNHDQLGWACFRIFAPEVENPFPIPPPQLPQLWSRCTPAEPAAMTCTLEIVPGPTHNAPHGLNGPSGLHCVNPPLAAKRSLLPIADHPPNPRQSGWKPLPGSRWPLVVDLITKSNQPVASSQNPGMGAKDGSQGGTYMATLWQFQSGVPPSPRCWMPGGRGWTRNHSCYEWTTWRSVPSRRTTSPPASCTASTPPSTRPGRPSRWGRSTTIWSPPGGVFWPTTCPTALCQ